MKQSFRINRLPSYSEIVNRSIYQSIVSEICNHINESRLMKMNRVWIDFIWVEKNRSRSLSKISSVGREIVIECLVKCGVIESNQWSSVIGFSDHFSCSSSDPHVKIFLDDLETITPSNKNSVNTNKVY